MLTVPENDFTLKGNWGFLWGALPQHSACTHTT